ncbi:MAG: very short patch repair endonuclease [Verrucomicrobiales bacterium]
MDTVTKKVRSRIMRSVRSKGNVSTEMRFIRVLRAHKLRGWRRGSLLPGRPDFVFPKERLAIFLDGCFWHGCQHCYRAPSSNVSYWQKKVAGNKARDKRVTRELKGRGWTVLRIWECRLKQEKQLKARLSKRFPDMANHSD